MAEERNPNSWKVPSEIEPSFDGGLIKGQFVKGSLFIVQTNAHKLALKKLYRVYNSKYSTMCFVLADKALYYLNNDAQGDTTTEADWTNVELGSGGTVTPVGEFEVTDGTIVETGETLEDIDAAGNNGKFYVAVGSPTLTTKTFSGLFRNNEVSIINGDWILSVGNYYIVLSPTVTWDALDKPQAIVDYVAGTVISHTHVAADISDLNTVLAGYLSTASVADSGENDISNVPISSIVDVEFFRKWAYIKSETYSKDEVDELLVPYLSNITTIATAQEWSEKIPDINSYSTIIITNIFTIPSGTWNLKDSTIIGDYESGQVDLGDAILQNVIGLVRMNISYPFSGGKIDLTNGKIRIIDSTTSGPVFRVTGTCVVHLLENSQISDLEGQTGQANHITIVNESTYDGNSALFLKGEYTTITINNNVYTTDFRSTATLKSGGSIFITFNTSLIRCSTVSADTVVGDFQLTNLLTDDIVLTEAQLTEGITSTTESTGSRSPYIKDTTSERKETIDATGDAQPDSLKNYAGTITLNNANTNINKLVGTFPKQIVINGGNSGCTIVNGDGTEGSFETPYPIIIGAGEERTFNWKKLSSGNYGWKAEPITSLETFTKKIHVTSAQIKALNIPLELIPAQGVNKVILPKKILTHYKFGTIQYSNAGSVGFHYGSGVSATFSHTMNLQGATQSFLNNASIKTVQRNISDMANQPLTLYDADDTPTNGDGTLNIYIEYTVIDVS